MKNKRKSSGFTSIFFSLMLVITLTLSGCDLLDFLDDSDDGSGDDTQSQVAWTVMVYGDGDNNLESYLLADIEEMKAGFVNDQSINLIVLADRSADYVSSTDGLGEDFTDTRLYRITSNTATRIGGGTDFPEITTSSTYEANMGDAETLKKFIMSCKTNYPADNYALIMWNHGSGPVKSIAADDSVSERPDYKGVCSDETDGDDIIYTAEITDILSYDESVQLLGFDACLMGSIEVAYQYRNKAANDSFEAEYMVASPAEEWGYGWDYENIFSRLKSGDGNNGEANHILGSGYESYYDPATMTAKQFGEVIVEEQYDSTQSSVYGKDQTLSLYDLSESTVGAVKDAVDNYAATASQSRLEAIRGSYSAGANGIFYFNDKDETYWISYPLFDLYGLADSASATTITAAVDAMVIYSFAGSSYTSFTEGKNGMHIFFPDGDEGYNGYPHWAYQWWYNSIDVSSNGAYGKLLWCSDGADPSTGVAGNWFELLDSWYDVSNTSSGGYNGYQY